MMASESIWDQLVYLIRNIDSPQAGHSVVGSIYISDQKILDAIKNCCLSEDANLEITSGESFTNISIGQSVDIRCYPRIGWGRIASDLDALLKTPKARIKEPRRYVLISPEIHAMSDESTKNDCVFKYRKIVELISTLQEASAFLNEEEQCLVFINSGRFDIPVVYNSEDLDKISLSDVDKIIESLPEGLHRQQCRVIMAEAIVSLTKTQPESKRFQYILYNLSDLLRSYENSYQLFASGFSYEKIKDQVESARIEYTGKIHKVLSDIQNQLLGLPVATIVVATQMKSSSQNEFALWINSAVLFGIWVFSVLIGFLIYNQKSTLDVIENEIERQKNQLMSTYPAIWDNFESVFSYLFKRIKTQKIILCILFLILLSALIGSHFIYFNFTEPALELLRSWNDYFQLWIKGK